MNVVRQPATQNVEQQPSIEPRSSFKLTQSIERASNNTSNNKTAGVSPSVNGVRLAAHSSQSAEASSSPSTTSNGVWYDRSAVVETQKGKLLVGPPTGKINQVQRARYQDSGLPPFKDQLDSAPDELPRDVEPPIFNNPSIKPGSSLLEPQQIVPNPFPGSKNPKTDADRSPSDSLEPPKMRPNKDKDRENDLDLDRPPPPPRRQDQSIADCNSIRQSAKDSDIRKINVDNSPSFVEGYKNKSAKTQNTKESFIASAPFRTWYNNDGAIIAEGKLVDLVQGSAVFQKVDGTRMSYLLRKLSDSDQAYISEAWGFPVVCSIEDRSFPSRDFTETTMTWKASGACHKPLYFEEVQLERYGHEWGPVAQPVISTAHFFGNIAVLPYKMGIHPMNECQYSLGYYRPGSCAPWTLGPVPLSLRGALVQAKVVTGAALALP